MLRLGAVATVAWVAASVALVAIMAGRLSRASVLSVGLGALVPWWLVLAAVLGVVALGMGRVLVGGVTLAAAALGVVVRRSPRPWRSHGRTRGTRSAERPPDPTETGPRLRLFVANLWSANVDAGVLASEIEASAPDVVVLAELTPRHLERLERTGVLDGYRGRAIEAQLGAHGMGLWTAAELEATWWDLAWIPQVRASLTVPGGGRVVLHGVHVAAPVPGSVARWHRALEGLGEHLAGEDEHSTLVVAGDFNATWDHGPFRRLLELGLVDAAVRRRRGWQMTWPNGRRLVPPLVCIDHVLVSRDVAVTGYALGAGRGSDHRPLVVDLRLRRGPPGR